jgi:hypothetical protein
MKPIASTLPASSLSLAELLRRLDEMPMTAHERARAKATLETAERIVEWLASVVMMLRLPAARIASPSTRRSTLRSSPAPR